jgi:hypothetical protein
LPLPFRNKYLSNASDVSKIAANDQNSSSKANDGDFLNFQSFAPSWPRYLISEIQVQLECGFPPWQNLMTTLRHLLCPKDGNRNFLVRYTNPVFVPGYYPPLS